MQVTEPNTYRTTKARIHDYTSFCHKLSKCRDIDEVQELEAEYLDMFSKLREEKQLGYEWHGFEYLDELTERVTDRINCLSIINNQQRDFYAY